MSFLPYLLYNYKGIALHKAQANEQFKIDNNAYLQEIIYRDLL